MKVMPVVALQLLDPPEPGEEQDLLIVGELGVRGVAPSFTIAALFSGRR